MSIAGGRNPRIDFLRGSAIVFMIITHVIISFYSGDSPFWDWWVWWGATVCFTIFLFVFAILYGQKLSRNALNTSKEAGRVVTLLIGYIVIGVYIEFFSSNADISHTLSRIPDIITLTYLPRLVEFILAFAWYIGITVVFAKFLKKILTKTWLIFAIGIGSHLVSRYAYTFDMGNLYLNATKAQLVGHSDFHSFGIVSYLPVFILGLWWGSKMYNNTLTLYIQKLIALVAVTTLSVLYFTNWSSWGRWPPTILFLLYGVSYFTVAWWLFSLYERFLKPVVTYVNTVGQSAFVYYIGHIVLIMPMTLVIEKHPSSILPSALILLGTLIALYAYSSWNQHKTLTKHTL